MSFSLGKLEGKAREALLGTRLFLPLRFGYQLLFDRPRLAYRSKMRSFYAPFVHEGDLVFDVGAHVGRHSEVFTELGAKVVAIEPIPVEVGVVTLDQLADRYGIPAFVKIDAEGYDDHVPKGTSFRPRGLCFEFNRLFPEVGIRCFEAPALASGYLFNFSRGLDLKYVSEDWMEGREICARLYDFVGSEEYGDVLAVRVLPTKQESVVSLPLV